MNKHFKYLSYVVRHKWFVFIECVKLGIPLQGIIHDLSKFSATEWIPYANYFYGEWRNGNTNRQAVAPIVLQASFEMAWNYHQKRNKHHWQYWVRIGDDGTILALPMPRKYLVEMLADWRGAGRAITGKDDTKDWYMKNRHKMKLSPYTRAWVESKLEIET